VSCMLHACMVRAWCAPNHIIIVAVVVATCTARRRPTNAFPGKCSHICQPAGQWVAQPEAKQPDFGRQIDLEGTMYHTQLMYPLVGAAAEIWAMGHAMGAPGPAGPRMVY
jgi:hypothetical protein